MKLLILTVFALMFVITPAFAENTLQNTNLIGKSAIVLLDIEFGEDTIKQGISRNHVTNNLDAITLIFYGDEIALTEPELKITSTGNHFRIHSVPEGIMIYGHKNIELENYKINIYLATDNGLSKFSVTTASQLADEKAITNKPIEEKAPYVPELTILSSHDFVTYWQGTFNIDVQSFDGNINSDPESFSDFGGRLDGADVKVLLTLDDKEPVTLSGITENNGQWAGSYFFPENISEVGEYTVDVIVSYLGQTVSKSTSMFIVGYVVSTDSTNHAPIAVANADITNPTHPDTVTLDASASSDPDGNTITYSWVQTNVPVVVLNNANTISPDFDTLGAGDTYVFQLTVTDSKGLTDTDTVDIIVT